MKLTINVVICNLCKSAFLFHPYSICVDPNLACDQALIIIGARRAFLRPREDLRRVGERSGTNYQC